MEHTKTPWTADKHPDAGYYQMHGQPGTNYIIALASKQADARRIVVCVNACEGIPTKLLEQGAGFWEKSNLHDEERDAAFADLLRENARLLEALKWTVENLQEASRLTDSEGGDYTEVYLPVINAANIAIAEAEKTTAP
jgi:hypothetical protein